MYIRTLSILGCCKIPKGMSRRDVGTQSPSDLKRQQFPLIFIFPTRQEKLLQSCHPPGSTILTSISSCPSSIKPSSTLSSPSFSRSPYAPSPPPTPILPSYLPRPTSSFSPCTTFSSSYPLSSRQMVPLAKWIMMRGVRWW